MSQTRPRVGVWVLASLVLAGAACGKSNKGGFNAGRADGGGIDTFGDAGANGHCLSASPSTSSVGCEYYAVHMDGLFGAEGGCFVVYLVNTNDAPAHFQVTFDDASVDLATYAKIPNGAGRSISYDPFDPVVGLLPGQVTILFLSGLANAGTPTGDWHDPVPCPVAPARSTLAQVRGTGIGRAFHILADEPVVAYQMLPYGGGQAAVTGATLLLPTTVYGTNYVAVNAYSAGNDPVGGASMNVVATQDGTHVTILPRAAIVAAGGVQGSPASTPLTYSLDHGQVLQVTQPAELTGSPVQSDAPIGLFAGHTCVDVPSGSPFCDHAEQQIPPISALGNEYNGVIYRQRTMTPENPPWRAIGVVDGTALTWDPPVGGPPTLNLSEVAEFRTATAFNVRSQDAEHPFLLLQTMSGATTVGGPSAQGYGDADVVRTVPVAQYLGRYVFFTDPTYPETNLVVTRVNGASGFSDVTLDCAGTLTGWQPLGVGGAYEYTRVDLVRHDFQPQGGCNNGRHEMNGNGFFGLTVWGWGSPETQATTGYVSYGYAAGESVGQLNSVVVPTK